MGITKVIFTLACMTAYSFSMSHNEAIQRCETRVNLLKGQTDRVMDESFRTSLKKIMDDMLQTLQKLRAAKTAQDIFALSNDCHNGARSAEWMVERYGKPTSTNFQETASQKSLEQQPQVESLLTQTTPEPKPVNKYEKTATKKVAAKKSRPKKPKILRAKHATTKRSRNKGSSPIAA